MTHGFAVRFVAVSAIVLGAAVALQAAEAAPADAGRKNVLLIISDDLTTTAIGCYGHELAHTPNIDAFATRGVRFDHAYCQYPLCNPSRCSFMTGRRPDTTKIFGNGKNFRVNLPNVETIPQHFQKAGYFAARVGKIYHYNVPDQIGTSGLDDGASWNEVVNPRGRDKDEEQDVIRFTDLGKQGSLGASLCWLETEGDGSDHTDAKIADACIKMLEEHRDRPFFIGCGFFRPHVPCVASKNYFDLYPLSRFHLPEEPRGHIAGIPPIALTVMPLNYGLDDEKLRIFMRAYYASASLMDAQTGRVLAALDRLGLADKTVVVFISDHGWCLGEHGQWQKWLLFEESARVPMIIYDPANSVRGKICSRPVELVDLYATLADLCGLPAPAGVEGQSVRLLVENPEGAWDRPARTQVVHGKVMGRSVRTDRWRYTEWDGGKAGSELYDQQTDPHEYHNLAGDPKHADIVATLKRSLSYSQQTGGKKIP
jgi:iduronate 2-sulfatase